MNPLKLLEAVINSPADRGQVVDEGVTGINNFNENLGDQSWRYWTGNPKSEKSKLAEKMAVGFMLGTANQGPSIEQMSNLASGWKIPGLKSQFDYGLLTKNPTTIKNALPHVPEAYLQSGFGPQAYETLLKAARPEILQKVVGSMAKPLI